MRAVFVMTLCAAALAACDKDKPAAPGVEPSEGPVAKSDEPKQPTSEAPEPDAAKAEAPTGEPDAKGTQPAPDAKGAAPSSEHWDEGTFALSAQGHRLGKETFSIDEVDREVGGSGYIVRTLTEMSLGMAQVKMKGELDVTDDWAPLEASFEGESGGKKVRSVVKKTAEGLVDETTVDGQTSKRTIEEPIHLFMADNTMAHATALCALAGAETKKLKAHPGVAVTVLPKVSVELSEGRRGERVVADLAGMARFEVGCIDGRVISVNVPIAGFKAIREGSEADAKALESVERVKPMTPKDVDEEDHSVEVPAEAPGGGAKLSCSLMLPKARGEAKVPGVMFLSGSGPQDRDEDTVGPGGLKLSIFKELAVALARNGIASLRCDDRGVGKSTGNFGAGTLETWVADGKEMLASLRAHERIDADRVGIIGHSEGAVTGPIVAAADGKVAAVVLMAGPGRGMDVLVLEQLKAQMEASKAPEAAAKQQLDTARRVFESLKKNGTVPDDLQGTEKAAWGATAPWMLSHIKHDPLETIAKLAKTPVMIAQGAKDRQVRVEDAKLLEKALLDAGSEQVQTRIYDDLNHLFAKTITGSLADYSDPNAKVSPRFIEDLTRFLTESLAKN